MTTPLCVGNGISQQVCALSRPGFLAGISTPSGADRYTCDEPVNDPKAEQK